MLKEIVEKKLLEFRGILMTEDEKEKIKKELNLSKKIERLLVETILEQESFSKLRICIRLSESPSKKICTVEIVFYFFLPFPKLIRKGYNIAPKELEDFIQNLRKLGFSKDILTGNYEVVFNF